MGPKNQAQDPRRGGRNVRGRTKRSKLPRDVTEDNLVLGKPRSRKERAAGHQGQSPRASQGKAQVQRDSHRRIVEE